MAALATFAAAELCNQLFLLVDSLPGTMPPALVMVAFQAPDIRHGAIARRA